MATLHGKVKARNVFLGNTTDENNAEIKLKVVEIDGGHEGTMVASGFGDHKIGDGSENYTDDIFLNLTKDTKNSTAWNMVDGWLRKHLIAPPPAPSDGAIVDVKGARFSVSWVNPPRVKLGFVGKEVPHVDEMVVQYRQADDTVDDKTADDYWEPSSVVTVNTTSPDCNKITLYTDGESDALDGTEYKKSGITPETKYDFRIYGVNENTVMDKYYHYVYGASTTAIGKPGAPVSVTMTGEVQVNSISVQYVEPVDFDDETEGYNKEPPIQHYKLVWSHAGNRTKDGQSRFNDGTFTDDDKNGVQTFTDNTATISDLYPFSDYTVKVSAKNTQNASYSEERVDTFSTGLPSNAGYINTANHDSLDDDNKLAIASPKYLNGTPATDFNGSTSNIIKASKVNLALIPNVDNSNGVATIHNNHPCANFNKVSNFTFTLSQYVEGEGEGEWQPIEVTSVDIGGFGQASNNNNGSTNATNTKVVIANDNDKNATNNLLSGFWRTCDVSTEFGNLNSVYDSGGVDSHVPTAYSTQLTQTFYDKDGNAVDGVMTCPRMGFYIDTLEVAPTVLNPCIYDVFSAGSIVQVCGAHTFVGGTKFLVQAGVDKVCGYFLRNDEKHLDVKLAGVMDGGTTTVKRGDTHKYYNAPGAAAYGRVSELHNTNGTQLTPNAPNIYWKGVEVTASSSTDIFEEDVTVHVTAYNTIGQGDATGEQQDESGAGKPIRFDTKSVYKKGLMDDATKTNGQLMYGGAGETPNIDSIVNFDHTKSLVNEYDKAHQLVNGKFVGPNHGDGFKDYGTFFWDGAATGIDYTTAPKTSDGYRWTTLKFTKNWTTSVNKIQVTVNGASLGGLDLADPSANTHKMFLYDSVLGGWMNMNVPVPNSGIQSGNGNMDTTSSTEGSRKVFIQDAEGEHTYYVRIGWDNSRNHSFESLKVDAA